MLNYLLSVLFVSLHKSFFCDVVELYTFFGRQKLTYCMGLQKKTVWVLQKGLYGYARVFENVFRINFWIVCKSSMGLQKRIVWVLQALKTQVIQQICTIGKKNHIQCKSNTEKPIQLKSCKTFNFISMMFVCYVLQVCFK